MIHTPSTPGRSPALRKIVELAEAGGSHLAFHPDGRRWAVLHLRQAHLGRDGAVERTLTAPEPPFDVAFSDDGKYLLLCPLVYDLEAGDWIDLPGLDDRLTAGLAAPPPWSSLPRSSLPRSHFLAVGGAWAADLDELVVIARYRPSRRPGAVDDYGGPRERVVLLGGRDRELRGVLHEGAFEISALEVGGRWVVVGSEPIGVWSRGARERQANLHRAAPSSTVLAVAAGCEGRQVAAGDAAGVVSLWSASDWQRVGSWAGHRDGVWALAFDPRQPRLVTGGRDGGLRFWSLEPPGRLLIEHPLEGWARSAAFSPAGDQIAVAVGGSRPRLEIYEG